MSQSFLNGKKKGKNIFFVQSTVSIKKHLIYNNTIFENIDVAFRKRKFVLF